MNDLPALSKRTQELIAEFHRRLRNRDWRGVRLLINDHPDLTADESVAAAILKLTATGRLETIRGRPPGTTNRPPLVVVGLIRELIRTGEARSIEAALQKLDERGLGSYEGLKKLYYAARSNRYSRALFFEDAEHGHVLTRRELKELVDVPTLDKH